MLLMFKQEKKYICNYKENKKEFPSKIQFVCHYILCLK